MKINDRILAIVKNDEKNVEKVIVEEVRESNSPEKYFWYSIDGYTLLSKLN